MNFLPGWFPGGAAAAGRLTTITQVLSATSVATTITAPSGIQAGDLIVMYDYAFGIYGVPGDVPPSGFTVISNLTDGSNNRAIAAYKLADGTEGGTSITGMTGSSPSAKAIYVFRGNIRAKTATVGDVGATQTSGNNAAQVVNVAAVLPPLIVLAFYGSNGSIDPRTFSPAKDGEIESFNDGTYGDAECWIAFKIYNLSPADTTVDIDDEGDENTLQSCYIQLA